MAFFICCCPSRAVGLYASLDRRCEVCLDSRYSVECYTTILGEPSGYFAQQNGGSIIPSDWEGQCDGGSKSVSLGHKTLLGVDDVFQSPVDADVTLGEIAGPEARAPFTTAANRESNVAVALVELAL